MTTRLPRHRVVIVAVSMALCSLAFGWTAMQVQHQADQNNHQSDQIDALYAALKAEQEDKEEQGLDPVAPPPDEIIEDPAAEMPEAVGPSDEQVLEAVHAYFREHPVEDGKDASPADIVAAVVNYLSENPPEPGPPPTEEQLLTAVATYLQANPPAAGPPGPAGADGQDGVDGEDGHTPTSAEIQAELAAYLEANPIRRCDEGWEYTVLTVLTPGPPTDIMVCTPQQSLELAVSGGGQRWRSGCLYGFCHSDGVLLGVVQLDSQWPSDGVPESPDVPAAVVELPCLDYVVLPRAPVPVRPPPPCLDGAGHTVFLDQQRIIRHTYESTRRLTMSDAITGLIRTWVPVGVGAFLSWLLAHNIEIDADAQKALTVSVTAVVIAVYYAVAMLLSKKWPVFGVLLGSTKQPQYSKQAELPPAE